ncbi:MAG: hypothetical protein H6628_03765 [Calditrichae bacterium]|nr:hypothetical protein [Calditrichia bacterium]
MARHFNQMGERLKATIAEAREKERLAFELQSARKCSSACCRADCRISRGTGLPPVCIPPPRWVEISMMSFH